jgi:hypothetical protein
LEVDVISNSGVQVLWDKVVFSGWVGLDDVSSLSSNIQVEDSGQSGNSIGSLGDSEDVRSVFEGSSELGGILSKGEFKKGIFVDDGVLLDWGGISIELRINESRSWVRHIIESVFSGGNVVSNSESAAASCIRFGAVFSRGNGPVVVVGKSWILLSISEVVFSGPWGLDAFGSRDSPGWLFFPGVSGGGTGGFIVWSGMDVGVGWVNAEVLGLDVLGFAGVKVAPVCVVGQDYNVFPRRWVPIRIVISFFWAFISVSVSVIVLSGVDG